MLPLTLRRQGLATLLFAFIYFTPVFTSAQEKDDEKQIDRYLYALRFEVPPSTVISAAEYAKIQALLDKFRSRIPADIQSQFNVQGEAADGRPSLTETQEATLKSITKQFFNEMAIEGLDMQKMQGFKTDYQKKNMKPGDNPLDPKIGWKGNYEGIERSMMGGRTLMVMDVWKQTLIEFFNAHPEAVGVVYGQLDIGSWVKMKINGLSFAGDIDFSSLATDPATNRKLVDLFGKNLKNVSGLSMKRLDAPLTAHGQAEADVYIGEWGKVFAEKFGKLKLLEMKRNENGYIVDVKMIEVEGKAILFQKSMEQEKKSLEKNPANNYELKNDIELKIDMEPMFSLEMLRHAMTDAEKGPFEGAQKIIKMIKCTERSFAIQRMASENSGYKPELTDAENRLKILAENIVKNKDNSLRVAELLEEFSGKKMESMDQVKELVTDIVQQCKQAMLKNSMQAFGYRIRSIGEIKDENARFAEADKFLENLQEEFNKGFKKAGVEVPKSMQRARSLLWDFRKGNISPELMEIKLQELNKLMEEEFKVDKSFVERWVGDAWIGLKTYLTKRGYDPADVMKIIAGWKLKANEGWQKYAPDLVQKGVTSTFEYVNRITEKCKAYDESLLKTEPGRKIHKGITALGYADMALALYDAWASGKDVTESGKQVATSIAMILSQAYVPFLAIPFGIYQAVETGSITPAFVGVMFYLFPIHFGGAYVVTNLIDRLIVKQIRDYNFRYHIDRMSLMAVTDGQGHIISFKIPNRFNPKDSTETEPLIPVEEPGRTKVLKDIFYSNIPEYPNVDHCLDIQYFKKLIPRKEDEWGGYNDKVNNLIKLFTFDNEFAGYMNGILQLKKKKVDGIWPLDDFASNRDKLLDELQTGIEDHFWKAVFTAIESSKKAEKAGAVAELETEIIKLQDDLFMGDYNMKSIDSLSLLLKIRKQISNDPLYIQYLKDDLSAGNAYERVAIPTLELYIMTYKQIQTIQDKIFEIWRPFGVDVTKLQEEPLRLLLMGAKMGAPMLTTNPETDLKMAIQCLEAHRKKATDIRVDLAGALGRPIKETEKEDKEHLRILGEYGFGFERLVDADPNGRSPYFKEVTAEIPKKMKEFRLAYQDYLAKLKEGPAIDVTLQLDGEKETTETNPVTARVTILNNKKQPVPLPPGTTLEWWLYDESTNKEIKVTEDNKYTHDAAKQGNFTYKIKLIKKVNNKQTDVTKVYWYINVKRFDATDPSKGIILKVPSVIKQYDIFDATLNIPAAIKGKQIKCNWGYNTIGKNDDCSGAKIQYTYELNATDKDGKKFLVDSTTVSCYVTIMVPGKTYGEVYDIKKKVKFQHMSINVKVSDIWEGGSGPNWFRINRKPINSAPRNAPWMDDKIARSTASAYALVGIKDDHPIGVTIKTLEDLKNYTDKKVKELAFRGVLLKEISMGDFKGYGLYTAAGYSPGGWSFDGYRGAGAGTNFSGYVMKGTKIFEVYWYASAGGAFDNLDKGWMMNMVKQLDAEAASILASASFQPDGRITKSPYTGPKLDGSDYPKVSIEPKVDTIQPGSKVSVQAVIKNDKPEYGPYTYTWSGQVEGSTSGSSAQLIADRPGKKSITVSVDGTTPPGSASMEYVVAPLKLRLTKVSPATNKIIVGMPVELRADFISPIPAGKKLQYLWQPHPEEKFDPFEGDKNTTKVIFTKPGNKKVWVQVLDKTTAETITMGESDQLEFVVEKPAFTITFNPVKAVVGQPVTAKISSVPDKLEEVSYRWLPLPANAQLVRESQDASEIIFYAKDALQIPFEVLSLVKGSGEELGKTKAYFNAERYNVKTEGPKVQGPKPMIWKPGVGLVEVDKEIAVHQIVEFSAIVTPQPASGITYDWKVAQGNASISNPTSKDARVTALETGTIQVNVTVKDNNGVILGTAVGAFNATISNDMITNGAKLKKEFDAKMNQARQLMQAGKLDEAVKLVLELKEMNAKDAAPLLNELGDACKKAATAAATDRDFDVAVKRCDQALQLNPNDATAKNQRDEMKKWAEAWTVIKAKGNELDNHITQKDLPAAEKNLSELNQLQAGMPGQTANKWTEEKSRKYAALVKSCDSAYAVTKTGSAVHFTANDFEKSLQVLEAFKTNWKALPATVKEIETTIQQCKNKITEQKKVYDGFLVTKSAFEKGLPTDPNQGPEKIENTAINSFSKNDPRQKEMIDFARNMKIKQDETNATKVRAAQLKNEGQQAEASGQIDVAIKKYKESVALVPDAELSSKIKILETKKIVPPDDPTAIQGNWTTQANEYGGNIGKQYRFYFPPGGNISGRVWGTDIYTTDCSIASAAVHAGLITAKDGGTVTIEIRSGQSNYKASKRNGVTSYDWGPFGSSFIFVSGSIVNPETIEPNIINGTWTTQANAYSANTGKQYTFNFPPVGTISSRVWGTDIYTYDCAIASAAVHAGLITARDGGTVTIEIRPGQSSYKGSTRNGVTSNDWEAFGGSFVFVSKDGKPVIPDDKGVNPANTKTEQKVFENGNIGGVSSGPPNPTQFTFTSTTVISRIENYHYFNGGKKPGTIGLRNSSGKTYGPWQAYGLIGQGGVQNAYWVVLPEIELPAGTYTVIDSDPPTWSYNSQSNGCGFTSIYTAKSVKKPVQDITGVKPADATKEDKVFETGNTGGVSSGPPNPTQFTFSNATMITRIENYHYFNGGKKPGTIGLRNNNTGKVYGPWQAYGLIGQGGVQNAFWDVIPNIEIPAGTYTVIDSDPSTWSYNSQSNGCGFTSIWTAKPGYKPNDPGYTIEDVETGGGVTAEKICISGDIDNLGFGFPKGFDVFSGNSTPSHGYPWKTDPNDATGTDCIMVGTGAKTNSDGYSSSTSRPGNQPQPITLSCLTEGMSIQSAVLQLFVDDFQAAAFGSKFSVTINGRQAAFLETVLNSLNQTGPVGKLISVQLPADFIREIQTGKLVIYIDDAISGRGDGYAVDFVRLIINPTSYSYTGTITGIVLRPDGQPAAGASINAGGIISTTANSKGEFTLNNVPAGMVSINASYNNHHHKTITTDLASGKTIRITINLPPDDAVTTTQPPSGNNEGAVTNISGILYGTVFKTKEEAGKTNPFDLEGVPLPNTRVDIKYIYNGTTYSKWVTSDGNGQFQFTGLPLNVTITATSRGQVVSKSLTSASPKQYVQFGWDGEIKINQP